MTGERVKGRGGGEGRGVRGVRGATALPPGPASWEAAVAELLRAMVQGNGIEVGDLAAAVFSLPPALASLRAAAVARALGWTAVPLLEVAQVERPGDLPRCVRVLLLWNTDRPASQVRHAYLGEAARLRPDLAGGAAPGEGE